ncbi:hypothetical protein CVT26_015177 [Gymnopilus dilepis]|uniref:Retrotransposon gag domain-containing protein n=1 Tax=Gymnopilus dilepis TaxID=231916 RepID=A0A409WS21_9AGAR|nr:hypothetical protein CVT26_015177 [Gymnopilus dilepis]
MSSSAPKKLPTAVTTRSRAAVAATPVPEPNQGSSAASRGNSKQSSSVNPTVEHTPSTAGVGGENLRGRTDQRGPDTSRSQVDRLVDSYGGAAGAKAARRSQSVDSSRNRSGERVSSTVATNVSVDILNQILVRLSAIEQAQETHGQGRDAVRKSVTPESSESPEPEHGSSAKGKGVDPLNWGNVGIPENELDPEVQRALHQQVKTSNSTKEVQNSQEREASVVQSEYEAAMDEIDRQYLAAKKAAAEKFSGMRAATGSDVAGRQSRIATTPMSADVEQLIIRAAGDDLSAHRAREVNFSDRVHPDSLLGRVFHASGRACGDGDYMPYKRDGFSARSQYPSAVRSEASDVVVRYKPLAPTPPDKYDGEATILKYYKFITQYTRFCNEARLPEEDRVIKCADYLTGKAYRWHSSVVSFDLGKYDTLQALFVGLFNYCFPPNFRMKERQKLENFTQGKYTVAEYAADLNIKFQMIGGYTPPQRIYKLWNGLRTELQSALWREGLDYERSSWDDIIRVATRHEIAEQIETGQKSAQRKEQQGQGKSDQGGKKPYFNNNNKGNSSSSQKGGPEQEKKPSGNKNNNFKDNKRSENASGSNSSSRKDDSKPGISCWKCGGAHYSKHCDQNQTVKSQKKGNPPGSKEKPSGSKSFNINVAMDTENQLMALDNSTESNDDAGAYAINIDAAMCGVDVTEEETESVMTESVDDEATEPTFASSFAEGARLIYDPDAGQFTEGRLGDPVCELLEEHLDSMRPFPGDPRGEERVLKRFCVYRTDGGRKFVIMDEVTGEDELVDTTLVYDPSFLIGRWYAIKCTQRARVRVKPLRRWHKRTPVGWPWGSIHTANAAWKLNTGRSFHKWVASPRRVRERLNDRFYVGWDWSNEKRGFVIDEFTGVHADIDLRHLSNPKFDIRHWYYKHWVKSLKAEYVETYSTFDFSRDLHNLFGDQSPEGEEDELEFIFDDSYEFTRSDFDTDSDSSFSGPDLESVSSSSDDESDFDDDSDGYESPGLEYVGDSESEDWYDIYTK